MGYVGNQTTTAFTSMAKQDITGDGGTGYTLDHAVANAQEIEVFVNNVRQEPGTAYTVSGTTLTMTGNVASTDDFYVVYQGKAIQTSVPGDNTVTTAMLQDDAATAAKVDSTLHLSTIKDSSGTNTAITITSGGLIVPKNVAFQVEASDLDQSIASQTNTVAQWEQVQLDTGSYWDSTNHRYKPQVAGWYLFGGVFRFATATGSYVSSYLRHNSNNIAHIQFNTGDVTDDVFSNGGISIPNFMVQMNGSTDYVDASFASENAATLHDSAGTSSLFWGMLVHAT